MGRRIRIWFLRLFALVIILLMVLTLGSNLFLSESSNQSEKTSQISETSNDSKYTYVSTISRYRLEAIGQDLLLPQGMTVENRSTNETTNAQVVTFGSVAYGDMTASLVLSIAESGKGANMDAIPMVSMETMSDGLKSSSDYSNKNYITFRGQSNNYLEQVQTLMDGDDAQYAYEIDYNIYDTVGKNYYMISLFLLSPENPSKTDLLKLDRMGQEMMSQTSYMKASISSEFALPQDQANAFNHIK